MESTTPNSVCGIVLTTPSPVWPWLDPPFELAPIGKPVLVPEGLGNATIEVLGPGPISFWWAEVAWLIPHSQLRWVYPLLQHYIDRSTGQGGFVLLERVLCQVIFHS
ncbi:hypothetical protein BDN72DRAFT_837223 [Pluteus cervinus]|uniref:Uncharacterized protein n=1 Tax=Pluteus cervinus TaxID=181527 RepID=A0ACD3B172_9AGAR|nr:hypothetical protein BDN72DRAFT_837223 [Pluteus cervinus]